MLGTHSARTATDERNFAVYPSHRGLLSINWSPKCSVRKGLSR
ncbi:hypothetical protein L842_5270 [Mycobacterium intracellulare MIN_052511_1280]|nr:hypothetical protein L842_5270 [Mycobacterium intracellulare MIN_052511_1280]